MTTPLTTYLLRTSTATRTAYEGFQYPEAGPVDAPDWNPRPECGGGLHGLLLGAGNAAELLDWSPEAVWQVLAVDAGSVVWIDGDKVKVPRGEVVYSGERQGALELLLTHGAERSVLPGLIQSGGDDARLTGGHGATLTGGDYAVLTGGYGATLTGGHYATLTGGDHAILTGGDEAVLSFRWWAGSRSRIAVAYVGEDGILPGVAYHCVRGNVEAA